MAAVVAFVVSGRAEDVVVLTVCVTFFSAGFLMADDVVAFLVVLVGECFGFEGCVCKVVELWVERLYIGLSKVE